MFPVTLSTMISLDDLIEEVATETFIGNDGVWHSHWAVEDTRRLASKISNPCSVQTYIMEEEAEYGPHTYEMEWALMDVEDYAVGYFAGF